MYAAEGSSAGGSKGGKVARLLRAVRRLARKERLAQDASSHGHSHSSAGSASHLDTASSDSELDDDWDMDCAPDDVPAGCLAVYVGEQEKRYVIPAAYLRHSLFRALLDKSVEEFGYHQQGGLHIPCQDLIFEHLLLLISSGDPASESMGLSDLLHFSTDSEGDLSA